MARVIVYFSNPYVLGLITLSMAGLVVAVFWPREGDIALSDLPGASVGDDPDAEHEWKPPS